jgi:hypothetical protein
MQGIMPPSLEAIISTAASFGDDVYERLKLLIQEPESTDPTDGDLLEVANEVDVPAEDLRYFLSFMSFLFVQTDETPEDGIRSKLVEFLSENGEGVDVERLTDKLLLLLAHRDVQSAASKRARLTDGFLPNLLGLANFVDQRSDFERDSKGKLTGDVGLSIPVIQLAMRTSSSNPAEKEIILQLDKYSLDKLQDTLDEIQEKLKILGGK